MGVFRLGLVGAGRMGRTHLRALASSADVAVVALAEPDQHGRSAVAEAFDMAAYPSLDEMIAAGDIDGVLVASPTDTHLAMVAAAAAAGLPVLCEKPCGTSAVQARQVLQQSTAAGVVVQVAYWRRYVPALQRLRTRISNGELGRVLGVVCSQWDGEPPVASFLVHSGGIFVDMGVHEVDQARWLLGGQLEGIGVANSGEANNSDPDGATLLATVASGTSVRASVVLSLGRYYPGGDMARVEVFATGDHVFDEFLSPSEGEAVQLLALERQAAAFADHVGGGPSTGATLDDAVAALELVEWAQNHLTRQHADE